MKRAIRLLAVVGGLLAAQFAVAQATPPAGSTGLCKDGTYSQAAHKQGACRGHQGVKEWYAASGGGASAGASTAPATPAAPATAPAPAAPAAPATKSAGYTPPATPAAGGGPGMVWVNTSTNVYHCPND